MYETGILTHDQATKFMAMVDLKIGVDYERSEIGLGAFYVVVFDLETREEINLCREIENNL